MSYKSIVLSGNPGAGKSALGEALSKEYNWPIHSIGRLWREKYAKERPKRDVSFEQFWKNTSLIDNRLVNEQAKLIFEKGGTIGELRYAKNLDPNVCLLVFVTADIKVRAARSVGREEYKSMSISQIAKSLEDRERAELDMAHELYGKDYDYRNRNNYHLVINSGKLSIAQEVSAINALMRG